MLNERFLEGKVAVVTLNLFLLSTLLLAIKTGNPLSDLSLLCYRKVQWFCGTYCRIKRHEMG